MTNKFAIFLEQLQLTHIHLPDVQLQRLVVDSSNQAWHFHLQTPLPLTTEDYLQICNAMQERFPYASHLVVEPENYTPEHVYQYWPLACQQIKREAVMLAKVLHAAKIEVCDANHLQVGVVDEITLQKSQRFTALIEQFYQQVGMPQQLNFVIDQASAELIKQRQQAEIIVEAVAPKPQAAPKPKAAEQPRRRGGNEFGKRKLSGPTQQLKSIQEPDGFTIIEGYVFDVEVRATRSGKKIMTAKITDYSDSLYLKAWLNEGEEPIQKGTWIKAGGPIDVDTFMNHELVMMVKNFEVIEHENRQDNAEKKRIEFHAHTQMSTLDGVVSAKDLVKQAISFGHRAIAITDHNGVQSFPDAYYASGKNKAIQVLYGVELNVVNDFTPIVINERPGVLTEQTYVIFDLETTGLSAAFEKIIEIGAVKVKDGQVIDKFQSFANPHQPLSAKTMELTNISERDVQTAPDVEQVVRQFKDWCEDAVLVAHNAAFDASFIKAAYRQFGLGPLENTVIDTLELSRNLYTQMKRHGLKILTRKFGIVLDNHHRAIFDAQATSEVFLFMLRDLKAAGITTLEGIHTLIDPEFAYKGGRPFHTVVFAKNEAGLSNLFKLVSFANTTYYHAGPRIPKSVFNQYRENLLVGSSCDSSELFKTLLSGSYEEAVAVAEFYDYIEVQPPQNYSHLVQSDNVGTEADLEQLIRWHIQIAQQLGKLWIASGDVHHLNEDEWRLRDIYVQSQVGVHPLARREINQIPSMYFRTTKEMLNCFGFLDEATRQALVIDNPHALADQFSPIQVIKDELFTPHMDTANDDVRNMSYDKAKSLYGDELPELIIARLEKELTSIIGNGFAVIYFISHQLVKKSLDDGYLVGSRGSVGSSFVATMMDITEVNPLPPHYRCPNCRYSEFLGGQYGCGYDMPDKTCPDCQTELMKDGHDIPFETFLGFEGDKVPDIDLNFSGDYQAQAHNYTKVLFGEDKVYRAGTIGTVAEKTAFGYVRGYESDKGMKLKGAEIDRLVLGCAGVKRTTGQHPGGIIVVPDYMDIYDITPIQYPADDVNSPWKTTHFDFHAIHDNLLKLDILGHDDPTVIRMLQDLSGIDPQTIPTDDPKVYSLFAGTQALGVTPEQINSEVGTFGVPEFGTKFVRQMLLDTKPSTFAELVQISGLSHGTDVWLNNAQKLVNDKTCTLKDVIGCRDDIMVYLMYAGLEPSLAFTIMESVRKGKGLIEDWEAAMKENKVPEWYIWSCKQIKYMFPKAHATAYVLMAVRIAWFKVHHPLYFYAAYFSVRASDFDIEAMIKGKNFIRARIDEISAKGLEASTKEKSLMTVLEVALEMCERGYHFKNIDVEKSDANVFLIEDDTLIPPFKTIDGLGNNVAEAIVAARLERPFTSKEDLQARGKVSKTLIAKLTTMDVLKHLPDSNQMTLDLF
ncbi:MAG: PolC-type DNA polymerase III [Culicoidibacterales bacterium]